MLRSLNTEHNWAVFGRIAAVIGLIATLAGLYAAYDSVFANKPDIEAKISTFPYHMTGAPTQIGTTLRVEVINHGNVQANGVELTVPYDPEVGAYKVIRQGSHTETKSLTTPIQLGSIRKDNPLTVIVWVEENELTETIGNYSISHTTGDGSISRGVVVYGAWEAIMEFMGDLVVLGGLFAALGLLIRFSPPDKEEELEAELKVIRSKLDELTERDN